MRGIEWQPYQLALASGASQREDDRALQAPKLAAAVDVQFDEIGGLQTRKPYLTLGSTTSTGGTITDARRHYENGNEHVLFTKDSLYSFDDQHNRWVFRATHLAVATEERTAFATPGDQYDCDRAELSGVVFFAWCDTDRVYVAAQDKSTGAVVMAPTALGGTATRPRLVALSTRVLLFWNDGTDASPGNLCVYSIGTSNSDIAGLAADLATPLFNPVVATGAFNAYYDVTRLLTTDTAVVVARRVTTTSYSIATVNASATVTATTKARTCDGPIAVASHPAGTSCHVIRANGTNIQGDRITIASFADVTTGQAIGTVDSTPVSQVTAAYRSAQDGGQYRCYAFWTSDEAADSSGWTSKYNYVDTGGTIGTEASFVRQLGIGSRAFSHDGRVFVWGVFAGESGFSGASPSKFRAQLQNTYFLYRDDATFHAKCASQRGGGLAPSVGRLPGVALVSGTTGYAWAATERRIISIGTSGRQKSFDKRAPRDVTFTFDSNDARRVARIGETLYVSGAEILQYDGVGLYEAGFHIYPWYFGAIEVGTGNLEDGTYTYKVTWRWENAKGELDRSTTATSGEVTIGGGPNGVSIVSWVPLYTTHKLTARPVAVEVWRTAKDPPEGAPFYLVTSKDPTALVNPNKHIRNAPTSNYLATFNDEFADSVATTKEANPENGDALENLAPPGARIIAANDVRVFLAGVSGDPDRVWYSKLRRPGEVVSFHDALTVDVPLAGGRITGLAFMNGILIVFRETATYMFPGDGFDNTGRGQNYGPVQVISYDIGCRDTDSIVTTPDGVAFQSSKGKYLLTRGWTMSPIGLAMSNYDSEPVLAAHVVGSQHQVRWLTASRMMVFDYLVDQWAEWTISGGLHATLWKGVYHYLAAGGPLAEQTSYSETEYGFDIETAWIKPNDLQGAASIRRLMLLAEFRGYCNVRCRIAYNYNKDWIDTSYWQPSAAAEGYAIQGHIKTSRQKMEAIKIRLTAVGDLVPAELETSGDLSVYVPGGGEFGGYFGYWTATFQSRELAELGDGVTVSVAVIVDPLATPSITVRDNWIWNGISEEWDQLDRNVGVLVISMGLGSTTIADVEDAIVADSELITVVDGHSGTAYVTDTDGSVQLGALSGGTFGAPTTEALKLTGLGMEVGIAPRLHKRFPRTGGVMT